MSIEKLSLPNSIHTIGAHALSYISIKTIQLPSNLLSYDQTNLQSCSYLEKIKIQNNPIYSIDHHALVKNRTILLRFPPAKQIKKVSIPSSIDEIAAGAYQDNSYIETVNTQNVKIIRERAFFSSASLRQVTITESAQRIEAEAFAHCEHLAKVIIKGTDPIDIAYSAFDDNSNLTLIISPERENALAGIKLHACHIKIEVKNV
jgi:hypothetical protein